MPTTLLLYFHCLASGIHTMSEKGKGKYVRRLSCAGLLPLFSFAVGSYT